jgi:hypothetical protein
MPVTLGVEQKLSQEFYESKKHEEWFRERYLPSSQLAKFERRCQWAKDEAQLFEVVTWCHLIGTVGQVGNDPYRLQRQLLQQPDLFIVSTSLDPNSDLEYHALLNRHVRETKAAATKATGAAGEQDGAAGPEASGVNGWVTRYRLPRATCAWQAELWPGPMAGLERASLLVMRPLWSLSR